MKIIDLKNTNLTEIIDQTTQVLAAGGLVIFPTETTYGAGVDATNSKAVEKLLAYKSRREGKPLSIAVTDKRMTSEYVFINKQANALIDQFLPGPVTVVCRVLKNDSSEKNKHDHEKTNISKSNIMIGHQSQIAPGVASEFGTLGIRIPDYQLILDIITKYKRPITATSANASGKKRPYTIDDILNNLSEKQKNLIDLVLDTGELPRNEPSTVIDTTLSTPITLRGNNLRKNKLISLISKSEQETKEIAGRILLKNWDEINKNGLIIALDGSLGTGKTVFTKGIAEFLGITETVKSPTYSYIEEYDFVRHQTTGRLYHLDMWKVEDKEMCERLEITTLFGKNNIVVIEWFNQVENFIDSKFGKTKIVKIEVTQDGVKRKLDICSS